MKKRLLLLVLSILGGAKMQAGSWFDSLRNYSPYQWSSVKRYAPENVASRLATMRYLYGNDVAEDQEQLRDEYYWYLLNKLDNESNRKSYLNHLLLKAQFPNLDYDVRESAAVKKLSSPIVKSLQDQVANSKNRWDRMINTAGTLFGPAMRKADAELLNPASFRQYQHPDQYILNY